MFKLWKFKIAGISVLRIFVGIVAALVAIPFLIWGVYFIATGFAWLAVFIAMFCTAISIFVANFYMAFVALFSPNLWTTMGNMWTWMWNWFTEGHFYLWPHIAKSFLPYMGWGLIFTSAVNLIEWLNKKMTSLKLSYA